MVQTEILGIRRVDSTRHCKARKCHGRGKKRGVNGGITKALEYLLKLTLWVWFSASAVAGHERHVTSVC